MLNVAAPLKYDIITADVKSAFLIPELSEEPNELTYIRVDKKLSDIIVSIKPQWSHLVNRDGTKTMKLLKALYGLPLAAFKWVTHLNGTLSKMGYQITDADKCVILKVKVILKLYCVVMLMIYYVLVRKLLLIVSS